jgi:hypothetical protein
MDASDAGDVSANPDVAPDAPEDTPVDTPDDARDVSTEADAATGCGITDGVWTVIPLMAWSYEYKRMWSTGPATFLFYGENGDLRRWNGSGSTALPTQPPPRPFTRESPLPYAPTSPIRGSGENDIWLGGDGPWQRTGVTDRLYVYVHHWDGVSWNDLTLVIPVSPGIQNPGGTGAAAFWPVGPDEAWQWANYYDSGLSKRSPYVAYHLEGGAWKTVPSPLETLDGTPAATWGAAKNDIWVGGAVNRQVPPTGDASAPTTAQDPLLLHWDGSIWTRVELPIANGNGLRFVASIWGSAANDVWAVGKTDASADTWHFDGDHWTEVPVVGPTYFDQVWGTCAGDYWAVRRGDPQPWHYDGRAWSPVALPMGMRATGAVTGTGPDDVWLSAEKEPTRIPYAQGAYPLAMHWARNRCGDGVVAGAESCDPPRTSGDGPRCDASCRRPRCGNGVTDPGEDCDPPNQGDGLQCDETCRRPICGNGVVDAGEECDPPVAGFCDRQCRSVPPTCGDNIKQAGEECDFTDPLKVFCFSNCAKVCFNNCLLGFPSTDTFASFRGLDSARCWSLLACMMGNRCVANGGPGSGGLLSSTCFCSYSNCAGGVAGPCVAEARAMLASIHPDLNTSDPAVLEREVNGFGIVNLIAREAVYALGAPTTGCRLLDCAGKL